MIDRDCAVKQVERLEQLNFRPGTREALNEVIRAVMTAAPDEATCQRVLEGIAQGAKEYPKPADIHQAFRAVTPQARRPPISSDVRCRSCNDSGLVEIQGNRLSGKAFAATGENLLDVFAHCPLCLVGQEMLLALSGERKASGDCAIPRMERKESLSQASLVAAWGPLAQGASA